MIGHIRKEDITECVHVIRESFLTVAEDFALTPENSPSFTGFATTEERLLHQLLVERRPMFAFRDHGIIVGYYSLKHKSDHDCELSNLAVSPACRHRGIGKKLLDHAFATAKALGYSRMDIGIIEENSVLKTWYESAGFIHTGKEKFDFFPFTCGAMTKKL